MVHENLKNKLESAEKCDVRVWSGDCQHSDFTNEGEKYLCSSCGKIARLDHEIGHEMFPHLKGDYDNLS